METASISANNRLAALSASFRGTLTLIPATWLNDDSALARARLPGTTASPSIDDTASKPAWAAAQSTHVDAPFNALAKPLASLAPSSTTSTCNQADVSTRGCAFLSLITQPPKSIFKRVASFSSLTTARITKWSCWAQAGGPSRVQASCNWAHNDAPILPAAWVTTTTSALLSGAVVARSRVFIVGRAGGCSAVVVT